jgi:magnesium-protoporphyrin IX monomethyl ester (oxidative) cyclase
MAAAPDCIHDMDRMPGPDYDDYFDALGASSLGPRFRPAWLIESARGCWWGARSHCTFCGLNGATVAFRARAPPACTPSWNGKNALWHWAFSGGGQHPGTPVFSPPVAHVETA